MEIRCSKPHRLNDRPQAVVVHLDVSQYEPFWSSQVLREYQLCQPQYPVGHTNMKRISEAEGMLQEPRVFQPPWSPYQNASQDTKPILHGCRQEWGDEIVIWGRDGFIFHNGETRAMKFKQYSEERVSNLGLSPATVIMSFEVRICWYALRAPLKLGRWWFRDKGEPW